VAQFIEARIRNRSGRTFPISIADMIGEMRQAFPTCEHTDEELERVIVANAVFANMNVAFDRSSRANAALGTDQHGSRNADSGTDALKPIK